MRMRFVRSLVLVFSLTLALPPGWCCLFASLPSCPVRSGSCCCTCPVPEQKAKPEPKPVKSPTAPLPKHCPCTDRQTILNAGPNAEQADLAVRFLTILPVFDLWPHLAQVILRVDSDAHPPRLRLHVLHCQWLC